MTEQPERSSRPSTDDVAVDDLAGVLSDPVTRRAATYLLGAERASLTELADVVTGWVDADADAGGVASRTDRDRTRIHLYHVTLPQLAEAGVVEFDPAARTARMTGRGETVRVVLEWYEAGGFAPATDQQR